MKNTAREESHIASDAHGVALIELAIVIPFFLFLLFAVIDLGRLSLGFGTVRSAAAIAVRRAAGSERPPWRIFQTIGDLPAPLSTLNAYPELKNPVSGTQWYGARPVTDLDPMEVRAISYANAILKESVGKIRYPCSDSADCAECFTTRGSGTAHELLVNVVGNRRSVPRARILGLECNLSVPILSSSIGFGLVPSFITVRARAYTPIETYDSGSL